MSESEFNVADGSIAILAMEKSPIALIKGSQLNTWFYAPRALRIARTSSDQPIFGITRNREHLPNGGGFKTLGGVFAAQLELGVPVPSSAEQSAWSDFVRKNSNLAIDNNALGFQPLRLRDGFMTISGVDQYVRDPQRLVKVPLGASSTVGFSLELNELGADTFVNALSSPEALKLNLVVRCDFSYDAVMPECHYKIVANTQRTYDFFSANAKLRASFFGLAEDKIDFNIVREQMQAAGAVRIDWIGKPDGMGVDRIKQLETSIIQMWTQSTLQLLTEQPHNDPAAAPDPNGFFGGISVAMKSIEQVRNVELTAEVNFSQLISNTFTVSYVFAHQFQKLDPREYVLDVIDDNKLPILINLGRDPSVFRYQAQFGYRKDDGSFVAGALTDVGGGNGGILRGVLQFGTEEKEPESTEVRLIVDWENPDWDDRSEVFILKNGDSGASFEFSPGNNIARVSVATDFELLPAGAVAIINWRSEGSDEKIYSGALAILGTGATGKMQLHPIAFPYREGAQKSTRILWDFIVTLPDGRELSKQGTHEVTRGMLPFLRAQHGLMQ